MIGWIVTLLALGAIAAPFIFFWRERAKSRKDLELGLAEPARALLDRRIAHLRLLTPAQRQRYEARVRRFVASKRYYGCDGLELTDEMGLLIAGLACLLILRPGAEVFPRLRSVLVYPGAFKVRHEEPDDLGLVDDDGEERIGESWQGDRVILSWDDVKSALDGGELNVVAHEFAHQLDAQEPMHEGAPPLKDYQRWSRVMLDAYAELQQKGSPVLDEYGTESPAEFFAVATETYFQRGAALRRHHAALYGLLKDYYGLDTAAL